MMKKIISVFISFSFFLFWFVPDMYAGGCDGILGADGTTCYPAQSPGAHGDCAGCGGCCVNGCCGTCDGDSDKPGCISWCDCHPSPACGNDGGGGEEEPPCETHDCGLPACPPGTTSTPNDYLIKDRVSCDKGCGETKYDHCYEIPPDCDPSITHVKGVQVTNLLDKVASVKGSKNNLCEPCDSTKQICQDHNNSAVHSDSQVNINTNSNNIPTPGIDVVSGSTQTSGSMNGLGCKSETWSGIEINNPIEMQARYWSTRDINRVEAIYFWMAKEGEQAGASGATVRGSSFGDNIIWFDSASFGPIHNVFGFSRGSDDFNFPTFGDYLSSSGKGRGSQSATSYELKYLLEQQVSSGKTATNSGFGFMVRRVNGQLSDIYIPKTGGNKGYWAKIGTVGSDFYIYGPHSKPMVKVSGLNITQGNEITAKFKLIFLNEKSKVSTFEKVHEGMYNIYTMANDVFGFTPKDNYPDDRGTTDRLPYEQNQIRFYNHWKKGSQWGIDLTPPKLEKSLQPVVTSPSVLSLQWKGIDNESSILHSIGNAFRIKADTVKNSEIIYPAGSGKKVLLNYRNSSDVLGKVNGSNILWSVANIANRDERIDMTDNRGGSAEFFVTLFDQGCNHKQETTQFNLNEWIQSKGGYFYSRGGTIINTKSLSAGLWKERALFDKYKLKENEADLATELLGGYVNAPTLLRQLNNSSTNKSYVAINFDGIKKSDVYSNYLDKVRKLPEGSVVKVNRATSTTLAGSLSSSCDNPSACQSKGVVYLVQGDITIQSGFKCDSRAVVIATGNMFVDPDITNSTSTSACVFMAGRDLTIRDGSNKSATNKIGFDVLDGYYIANGTLRISKENKNNTQRQDSLFVEGGLVSFGEGSQASIVLLRELHLEDRNIYPVLNIAHHAKYGKLMTEIFGGERLVFKSEIGYKEH